MFTPKSSNLFGTDISLTTSNLTASTLSLFATDDSFATAQDLGTAINFSPLTRGGWVGSSDTQDYYKVRLTSAGDLNISLTGMVADADLQLYNNAGTYLGSSAAWGSTDELMTYSGMAAGDYYIRVSRFSGDTSYTLRVSPTSVDNLLAVENTLGTLGSGTTYNRSGFISDTNTTDVYQFTLSNTSNIAISLTGLSADSDLRLIRDSNNNGIVDTGELLQAATLGGSAAESLNMQGMGAGKYFVLVYQYYGSTSYNLGITATVGNGIAYESNDSLSQALNLGTLNGNRIFNGYVGVGDNNDFFRFSLGTYSDFALNLTGTGDADVQLLDGAGNLISGSSNLFVTNEAISRRLETGDYFVQVKRGLDFPFWSNNSNYTLNLNATPHVADWTFMVYLDADNNLEGFGIDDFLEMAQIGSTANVNIVIEFDRSTGWYDSEGNFHDNTSYGNWTGTRRGLVRAGDTPTASWGTNIGEQNMGAQSTFSDFLSWGMSNYQANNYAVVLWNHGGGWNYIAGDDASGGDSLSANEVSNALATVSGIDLIGADACQMAMVEFAYQIRNYADVFVGSQANEPGSGWVYNTILGDLTSHSSWNARQLGTAIVDRSRPGAAGIPTMSAIDLNYMNLLSSRLSTLGSTIMASATNSDLSRLRTHRDSSATCDDPNDRDLGDFLARVVGDTTLSSSIRTAASNALTVYNASLITNHTEAGRRTTGMMIHFPSASGNVDGDYTSTNSMFAADSQWDEFLNWWT